MKFSVILPAHNEEQFLQGALNSIKKASEAFPGEVETIVSLNRCSDKTEEIAIKNGAAVVREERKCLSAIRNAGVKAAGGEIVLTLDADSRMSPDTLSEIEARLSSGKYIGGGALILPERWSLGLVVTALYLAPFIFRFDWNLSAGLFWCRKEDFWAVGGFNENLISVEDLDFARKLKDYGKRKGKKYGTLWKAGITTSCRKMDRFGDWFFIRHPLLGFRLLTGRDRKAADLYYYDFNDKSPKT
ncbi:MAG: glycosyl transferase family 2 [Elusimicrobia bacterium CG08_land_8_20_14_0_20_51_18]|nr:MAG: glycosyl transferase family 2 [Elusimicrobia bacterium CG08_land_8_20_14_0_20_51_18]